MTALPVTNYFTNPARTNGEAKQALDDMLEFAREDIGGAAISELTISSGGSITPISGLHRVDTFADASSDNLDNILTTNLAAGRLLVIRAEDTARTVVVRHGQGGAGQILLSNNGNFSLDDVKKWLLLYRNGTDWEEIGRFYGNDPTAFAAFYDVVENPMTTRGDLIYQGAAGPARRAVGTSVQFLGSDGTDPTWKEVGLPRGYIDGLEIDFISASPETNVNVNPGVCRNDANTGDVALAAAKLKYIDENWVEGNNQGGRFSGVNLTADTTYGIFLISKDADGTIDWGFDSNLTGTNKPVGWTVERLIALVFTSASSILLKLHQEADRFRLDVPIGDYNAAPGGSAVTITLSVPTGIIVYPIITVSATSDTTSESPAYGLVTGLDQPDTAPSSGMHNFSGGGTTGADISAGPAQIDYIPTNTSGQIRTRVTPSAVDHQRVMTFGWRWNRGRNA